MPHSAALAELVERARHGSRRSVARLLTLVEQGGDSAESVVRALYAYTGSAHVVGITGAPGSGKSSLVNEVAKGFRRRGQRVGIIAVDPSSPFTGGAILGDRIRMQDLSGDSGVFIRSMATRGSLGGLSRATAAATKVLDAAGYDVILIETVGAGQSEVDIAAAAHTTLVVEAPGMGDDIQTIKAGILEIADIIVLNKADRPGKDVTLAALRGMLRLGQSTRVMHHGVVEAVAGVGEAEGDSAEWETPLCQTVATSGDGIDALIDIIENHRRFLHTSNGWQQRERARSRQEISDLLHATVLDHLQATLPAADREQLIDAVVQRRLDPYSAAAQLAVRLAQTPLAMTPRHELDQGEKEA